MCMWLAINFIRVDGTLCAGVMSVCIIVLSVVIRYVCVWGATDSWLNTEHPIAGQDIQHHSMKLKVMCNMLNNPGSQWTLQLKM